MHVGDERRKRGRATLAEARRRFDAYVADPSADKCDGKKALPAEISAAVFKLVHKAGGEKEFDALQSLFEPLPLNDDKKQALLGLGARLEQR